MATSSVPMVPSVAAYGGDTLVFPTYSFVDPSGAAIDLSDWTWRAQWRRYLAAPTALTLLVDSSAAATGTIGLSCSAANTGTMGGPGIWDLEGTNGDVVKTWIQGTTTWQDGVTR